MKTKLYLIIIFVMFFGLGIAFAQEGDELVFDINSKSYFYNQDYVGIPSYKNASEIDTNYIGENVSLNMIYKAGKSVTFTAGVFAGIIYGSNEMSVPVMPILTFHYQPENNLQDKGAQQGSQQGAQLPSFYMIFGTLDRSRHNLIDAIFDDTLNYPKPLPAVAMFRRLPLVNATQVPRPLENGFEIFSAHLRPLIYQGWINWNYLNTSSSRESFDAASIILLDFKSWIGIEINGDWRYIHRGGQLYNYGALMDGHVFDTGLSYNPSFLQNAKLSVNFLWSHDVANRYRPELTLNGNGQVVRLDYNLYDFNLFTTYWNGKNYYTEDGNPFYQANNFVNFGVNKKIEITDGMNIEIGLTVYSIDSKFTHSEKVFINFDKIFDML
jgi:hypothetical protein